MVVWGRRSAYVKKAWDVPVHPRRTHETDVTAVDDAAATPSKKRRRSGGPARAAREAAFLASKAYDATDNP